MIRSEDVKFSFIEAFQAARRDTCGEYASEDLIDHFWDASESRKRLNADVPQEFLDHVFIDSEGAPRVADSACCSPASAAQSVGNAPERLSSSLRVLAAELRAKAHRAEFITREQLRAMADTLDAVAERTP